MQMLIGLGSEISRIDFNENTVATDWLLIVTVLVWFAIAKYIGALQSKDISTVKKKKTRKINKRIFLFMERIPLLDVGHDNHPADRFLAIDIFGSEQIF